MLKSFFLILILLSEQFLIPVRSSNRKSLSGINLTPIGQFGLPRKPRKNVPAHLHTGIDIKRPGNNYSNEPVYPIAKGKVISKRTDGPYAQLIIEHDLGNKKFWTLYEHIAGITINVNDIADPGVPIARFMNKKELDKYGWQFDHFHLEILKIKPFRLPPDKTHPERFYSAHTLSCYRMEDLQKYYYDPLKFMKENFN